MAFIKGQTVKDKIAERPLKLEEALDIGIQDSPGPESGTPERDRSPRHQTRQPNADRGRPSQGHGLWIGTVGHVIVFNERSLRRILRS